MDMNDSNVGVALVKELCRCCVKEMDGPIVLNTRLNASAAKKVEDMNGKVVGFAEKPCDECQGYMKQGVILVSVDEKLTEDMNNPYRTGGFFVLKDEAITRIFDTKMADRLVKKTRFGYIEHGAAVELELFQSQA